jgi:thiamine monophosphate synthase
MAANITKATEATAHLVENPLPNAANMALIFQCCPAVIGVFGICGLNERQKLALICQGINSIACSEKIVQQSKP